MSPAKCFKISNASVMVITPLPSTSPQLYGGTSKAAELAGKIVNIDSSIAAVSSMEIIFLFI